MTKESKAREFWIANQTTNENVRIELVAESPFEDDPVYEGIEQIHVIEYSAYEALEEKLRVAVEVLESIANSNGRGAEVYSAFDAVIWESKEALAKIQGGER